MGPFLVDLTVSRTVVFHISRVFPVVILVTFFLSCFISTSSQVYDYLLRPDVLHLRLIVFPLRVYSLRVLPPFPCRVFFASAWDFWFLSYRSWRVFNLFLLFVTYLFHLLIWIPLPVGLIVSVPTSAQLKKNPELLSCLFGGSIETSFKSNIEYEQFCTLEVQNVLCRERVWAGSELCADLERVSRGNSGNILSQKHPSKAGKLGVGGATRGFSSSKTGLNSPSRGVWWRGAGLWDHYWHFWCNTSAQVSKAACCVAGWLIWTRAGCFFWNFHCNLSCFVRPCVIIMCGVCVKLSAGALSSLIMCVVH